VGGLIHRTTITSRVLYPAMERAGIPRLEPTDEERSLISLRQTFARRVLESGTPITWVKEQLGHSPIAVTVDVYGHRETEARKREAERVLKAFSG
jgi:integrase